MAGSNRVSRLLFCTASLGLFGTVDVLQAQPRDNRPQDQETIRRLEAVIPVIRESLKSGNVDSQKAALTLLGDLPPILIAKAELSPAIRNLLEQKTNDQELTQLALRAFSRSYPLPADVEKVYGAFSKSTDPKIQAALSASASELIANNVPSSKSVRNAKPFADIAAVALPQLSNLLASKEASTRRSAIAGFQTIGSALSDIFSFESNPARDLLPEEPKVKGTRWDPLTPILTRLDSELPKLAAVLSDPDAGNRLLAVQAIESLSNARKIAILGDPTIKFGVEGFKQLIPQLSARIKDPDPSIRLAAIEAIDPLGRELVPSDVLISGTTDSDLYVRWAAVRALGKIAPATPSGDQISSTTSIQALAKVVNDPDVDIRSAALLALQKYGTAAKIATPEIVRSVTHGDVECRIIAMRALVILKLDAAVAVPALIPALKDDIRLARSAAIALGRYGVDAKKAVPDLRQALQSNDQELRLAAGEALLLIENPKKPKDF